MFDSPRFRCGNIDFQHATRNRRCQRCRSRGRLHQRAGKRQVKAVEIDRRAILDAEIEPPEIHVGRQLLQRPQHAGGSKDGIRERLKLFLRLKENLDVFRRFAQTAGRSHIDHVVVVDVPAPGIVVPFDQFGERRHRGIDRERHRSVDVINRFEAEGRFSAIGVKDER